MITSLHAAWYIAIVCFSSFSSLLFSPASGLQGDGNGEANVQFFSMEGLLRYTEKLDFSSSRPENLGISNIRGGASSGVALLCGDNGVLPEDDGKACGRGLVADRTLDSLLFEMTRTVQKSGSHHITWNVINFE
ncbi:unnamed protein product [Cochlearia groenlandica]